MSVLKEISDHLEIVIKERASEREASCPSDATDCSPRPVFDRDLLTRSILNEKAAEIFRAESKQVILRDPETDARVVCYQHPDGRVLLDAVRLPENA